MLTIKQSTIKGAGLGVFAIQDIRKGTRLGEYCGKILSKEEYEDMQDNDRNYIFEVHRPNQSTFYIDGNCVLAKVNGVKTTRQKKRINVEAYQYAQCIYFRTTKEVPKGTELIIDYGNKYW